MVFCSKVRSRNTLLLFTMGIGVIILGLAVGKISYLFEALHEIQKNLPVDGKHISTLVKILGITYIGQFSSGICKDAGYGATGTQIELFCKLSLMVLGLYGSSCSFTDHTGVFCMKKILGTVIVFLFSALIFSVPVKGEEKIARGTDKKDGI